VQDESPENTMYIKCSFDEGLGEKYVHSFLELIKK